MRAGVQCQLSIQRVLRPGECGQGVSLLVLYSSCYQG